MNVILESSAILSSSQISDLRLAAQKMTGVDSRSFQAEMSLKYCSGNARQTERLIGWGRATVELGLNERRTGILCIGCQSGYSGAKRWEEKYPEASSALRQLAEAHCQLDPTFKSTIGYTRLTAKEALSHLKEQGFEPVLPSASSMAMILNRMGYRLRPVVKAKPKKKLPETDAIFKNLKAMDLTNRSSVTKRLSLDCKATVKLGEFSRSGVTRGENQALDHDFGAFDKYIPFGIVDEDSGQLYVSFGSSFKTSDFIVDELHNWWKALPTEEQNSMELLQLKVDNGPESSGIRTQFLNRMVKFVDQIGKPIQLLYYPPYHSKYNPIERCWGILEKHWNGTLLRDVTTMLFWAQTMTWKGICPIVKLNQNVYEKGVALSKTAMKAIEQRLQRNPELPKWDILIQPLIG